MGGPDAAPLAAIEPAPQAAASDEDSGDDSDQVVLERQPPRATPAVSPGTPVRLHWRSLSDGALVCFLITAPSLFAGFILRDQRMRVWVLMLPVAAAGFFLGGAIAGRHRRAVRGAVDQGAACALLTTTIIVIADAIRRAVLGQTLSARTVELWLGVELASIMVAVLGALFGRRLYIRARKRKAFRR